MMPAVVTVGQKENLLQISIAIQFAPCVKDINIYIKDIVIYLKA